MKPDVAQLPDDEGIEAAAADWLTERGDGFTDAQALAFEQWRRRDPRHAAAVARLEKTCALLDKLPLVRAQLPAANAAEQHSMPACPDASGKFRAARWWGGMAAAVAIGFSIWLGWPPADGETRHVTATGGYERVALKDGSVLELNGDTQVQVRFSGQERSVTLAAGEAHFIVAHDAARPFVVRAGTVAVRAVGTAFSVRLAPADVEVLVTEGRVAVAESDAVPPLDPRPEAVESEPVIVRSVPALRAELAANQRLVIPKVRTSADDAAATVPVVESLEPEAIRRALAWQERKLVFVDTPLSEVAEQFNRHNRIQIVIADPTLAGRPVGGTFASNNVTTFVRLLEESGDIAAEYRSDREIVLRKAR